MDGYNKPEHNAKKVGSSLSCVRRRLRDCRKPQNNWFWTVELINTFSDWSWRRPTREVTLHLLSQKKVTPSLPPVSHGYIFIYYLLIRPVNSHFNGSIDFRTTDRTNISWFQYWVRMVIIKDPLYFLWFGSLKILNFNDPNRLMCS